MFRLALAAALMLAPAETPVPLHAGGRVTADGRFGWPGVYFEGRFKGTAVTVSVEAGTDHLAILIDGVERAVLQKPGRVERRFDGLGEGEHVIRVEKLTETQSGYSRMLGITTNGTPLSPIVRARRVEFIGDSHSVGYGDTSDSRTCTPEAVHDTTNTALAFGPLLAKKWGADYRVIAFSGRGVVRNYAGGNPGETLPVLYPRAIPGEPAAAARDGWKPQLIVLNLGTNDFSTPVHAGEAWKDEAALRADYRASYVAFVRRLQQANPGAHFLLMGAANFIADVRAVAAETKASAVEVPTLALTGCNFHPSLADQQRMADLVEAAVGKPD
ncbi:lipase [Sphingomonas sp. ABOLD]|uniref:Lysophospholipase L1-like esterase n=1 Tax=Sphingomonas trueperi TaxID=53317 RepID=A0A7X5Y139_9SPHN|nr:MULTISPECIES: SGNH/GDSL hydrolase family protein [Sphingomonas]NJB98665.1 lysophospholipase L1-like esterase [Sphingomonas trueperi]RSV43956.1 lipase [Sphingomonas sp. ABOLE]RSV45839.1 lipase [Sphingomonas sp. ABOLD]